MPKGRDGLLELPYGVNPEVCRSARRVRARPDGQTYRKHKHFQTFLEMLKKPGI